MFMAINIGRYTMTGYKIRSSIPKSHQIRQKSVDWLSMMRVFTERCLGADFHFNLNVNVNVTDDSYMNSTSRETILRNFLQQ